MRIPWESSMSNSETTKYRLLEEILTIKGLPLQATYTNGDLARIFDVSIRAIQNRVASGQLIPRNLPGRAKFLTQDLEDFLMASRRSR
jgi:hypothetical protein